MSKSTRGTFAERKSLHSNKILRQSIKGSNAINSQNSFKVKDKQRSKLRMTLRPANVDCRYMTVNEEDK